MTDVETGETSLTVRRTYDAPRERVYRAFTDPEELAAWYAPGDMTAHVDALEAEEGGELSVRMVGDEGTHEARGRFVEVVEGERLVHTWRWVDGDVPGVSRVTVTFRDVDGGTEVTLTHEELPGAEAVERHAEGWAAILEKLEGVL